VEATYHYFPIIFHFSYSSFPGLAGFYNKEFFQEIFKKILKKTLDKKSPSIITESIKQFTFSL